MATAATPQAASRRRRARFTGRAVVLGVLVVLILAAAIAPLRNLLDQRSQMASLEHQQVQLHRENDRLQAQIDRLNDPTYLQQLARECLGMVMPGEIAFRTIPKQGSPTPLHC
jgi:cell division protein FtsB